MPKIYIARDLAAGRLVEVLPGSAGAPMPVHAVYPSRSSGDPTLAALLGLLEARWISLWEAELGA